MKIEQQVGGSAPTQNAFTGEDRQITVDTDNYDLRLHDGDTPGGHRILNRDNNDQRYQAKSAELNGISFPPEQRGFLTRIGTGQWRIRTLACDTNVFTWTNPNGYGGNPTLTLNTTVVGDRVLDGDIIVTGVMQVDGGINADTSGTHFGNVEGDVTGNVTGDLAGDATGNHSGTFTGAGDFRGAALLLDPSQISTTAIAGLLAYIKANAEEPGTIKLWYGSVATIPAGWTLCNGLLGTPDLRDLFVAGAGGGLNPGDTGGASTHSHATTVNADGAHTHGFTSDGHTLTIAEMPAHNHGNGVCDDNVGAIMSYGTKVGPAGGNTDNGAGTNNLQGITETIGSGDPHDHTGTTGSGGSHTHTLNNALGSSIPPYYALCYIMKLA